MAQVEMPREQLLFGRVSDDGKNGAVFRGVVGSREAFDPKRDYVTVKILSFSDARLFDWADSGGFFRRKAKDALVDYSAVHLRLAARASTSEQIAVDHRNLIAPTFLGEFASERLGRVLQRDMHALGPIPFRQGLSLEMGLFSVKNDARMASSLNLLSRVAQDASIPFVEQSKNFASALGDGLNLLLGFQNGLKLEVGLLQSLGLEGSRGIFTIVHRLDTDLSLDDLVLREDLKLAHRETGNQIIQPHIVFEIEATQERDDWPSSPQISEAWNELRQLVLADGDATLVKGAMRRLQRVILFSPDLTEHHALRIVKWAETKLERVLETYQYESSSSNAQPDLGSLHAYFDDDDHQEWEASNNEYETTDFDPLDHIRSSEEYPEGFKIAMRSVFKHEGGFVDNEHDFGGPTNLGVTQSTLDRWRRSQGWPRAIVSELTHAEAVEIYYTNYWLASGCDRVEHDGLALLLFDTGVLFGTNRAQRILQLTLTKQLDTKLGSRVLRNFVDGAIGPNTLDKLDRAKNADGGVLAVIASYLSLRAGYHRSRVIQELSGRHQGEFLMGWLNRVESLHSEIFGSPPSSASYSAWGNAESKSSTPNIGDFGSNNSNDWVDPFEDDTEFEEADEALEGAAPFSAAIGEDEDKKLLSFSLERYKSNLLQSLGLIEDEESLSTHLNDRRKSRDFDAVHLGAAVYRATGKQNFKIGNLEIQALNELKAFDAARALATSMIADITSNGTIDPDHQTAWMDAYGHIGRSFKQEYADWFGAGSNPAQKGEMAQSLRSSFDAYKTVFDKFGSQAIWHGANVLAVAALAQEDGIDLSVNDISIPVIAETLIKLIHERDHRRQVLQAEKSELTQDQSVELSELEENFAWDIASEAEANVALGHFEKAKHLYAEFIHARIDLHDQTGEAYKQSDITDFGLASAFRQLDEIWRLGKSTNPVARQLYLTMKMTVARMPGAQVEITLEELRELDNSDFESSDELQNANDVLYEKVYGPETIPLLSWNERFLKTAKAIGRVDLNRRNRLTKKRPPKGSGFLIDGKLLRPEWVGKKLFITNEHVVSKRQRELSILPESAVIEFSMGDPGTDYKISNVLWQSDRTQHDITICELTPTPQIEPIDEMEQDLPDLKNGDPLEVTVIGHPEGRVLSFAPSNLQVVYHDGPDQLGLGRPVRLHYKSSTEPGNSGSPALDWRTMTLVGVHHAGIGRHYEYLPPKRGRFIRRELGKKKVNEAISIGSVYRALNSKKHRKAPIT